jgi:hypothetical protein
MRYAESAAFDDVPLVRIYLQIVYTLQEKDGDKAFETLSQLLTQHIGLFPKEEAEQFYAFAVNYCIRQINKGDTEYKNIVTVALRARELAWAAAFIKDNIGYVPAYDRDNAYTFNMARYAFAARRYDEVLQLLSTVEYDDVFYQLDAKTTLMKTYYELGEYQPLQSLKDSFRLLLSRNKKISDTQRTVYNNFVRYTLKLFRADVKDRKKIATLQKEIETIRQIADKSWLKEKLGEMV